MKKVLEKILPNNEEISILKKEINEFLDKFKSLKGVKFIVGGSYAKGTWLSGNNEADIFARFNYDKYRNKDISKELKKLLVNKKIKFNLVHGSRDYFHFTKGNILFEVIPVLDIKNYKKAINVMDVSPLHINYVKKNTNIKLKNEIRLLKQFCKANGVYGAESYIRGFSGYVLEVLIINYGSFKKLLNAVKKWKDKQILDPAKHYKNKNEVLLNLIDSKKDSPLILIDPVQKNRNMAAGLSKKSFEDFISLANNYDGSELFFIKKEVDLTKLKGYTIFEIRPLEGKKDIVGAKLLKALEKTKSSIEREGFKVYEYGWKWENNAYFWFKTSKSLDKIKKHYGPKIKMKEHIELFKKRWKGKKFCIGKGRVYVNIKRDKIHAKDIIKDILKRSDIKSNFRYQKTYK